MFSASDDERGHVQVWQTATPYVRHNSIYFVPVWRYHLNFAVLVQRAVQQLQLSRQDLVAVGLPQSVAEPVKAAIAKLPRISLVVSTLQDMDQREVFGITPCDGIVEGIRVALEQQIPLQFIDQEIPPGHLLNHVCIPDENWPDDALALQHGAEWYLNLTQVRLTHPPSRFEPVDSWREIYMATQLRRLYPRFRRILVICGAPHVLPIRRLLGEPVSLAEVDSPALPTPRYAILEPSLGILMRYLDYLPRLVEQYEKQRAKGTADDFDKRTALLRLVYELSQNTPDVSFSIRHYQAFTHMLTKLLEYEGRISPRFETVLLACRSAFNNPFTERIYRHLLGYYDQVRTERIGQVRGTEEAVFEVNLANVQDAGRIFVARNCAQIEQGYEIYSLQGDQSGQDTETTPSVAPDHPPGQIRVIDLERPLAQQRPKWRLNRLFSEWTTSSWPAIDSFVNDMRHKAYNLAETSAEPRVKIIEFQGSILDGFDLRRTLRSYYALQPKLYVKQRIAVPGIAVDRNEPIVWIYDMHISPYVDGSEWQFDSAYSGLRDGPRYITDWFVQNSRKEVFAGRNKYGQEVTVDVQEFCGRVSFKDWGLTHQELETRLGGELDSRIPIPEGLTYLESFGDVPWLDILLIGALKYAKESVILVAPQEFVISSRVAKAEIELGKMVIHMPLSKFTSEEFRKLTKHYWLTHRVEIESNDVNDPLFRLQLTEQFGDVMLQFWE